MPEQAAYSRLAPTTGPEKLRMWHQGVDVARFPVLAPRWMERPTVLVYSRLADGREKLLVELVDRLDTRAYDVMVVGDGPGFWDIVDRRGEDVLAANFVPYASVPQLLRSGRM